MHPINKLLSLVGLSLSRVNTHGKQIDDNERAFEQRYENYYKLVEGNKRGFKVIRAYRYQAGRHPFKIQDLEFEFAAYHLYKFKPSSILDWIIQAFHLRFTGTLQRNNLGYS